MLRSLGLDTPFGLLDQRLLSMTYYDNNPLAKDRNLCISLKFVTMSIELLILQINCCHSTSLSKGIMVSDQLGKS